MHPWYKQEGTTGTYQSHLWAMAVLASRHSYTGESWGTFYIRFKRNYLGVLWDENQLEKVATKVLTLSNQGLPSGWIHDFEAVDTKLTDAAYRISQANLSVLSLIELRQEYDHVFTVDQDMWKVSIFIDTFDPGYDQREIQRIALRNKLTDSEVQILLTPAAPSYLAEWNRSLILYGDGAVTVTDLLARFFWVATDYFSFAELTEERIKEAYLEVHGDAETLAAEEEADILKKHSLDKNPLELFRTLTQWRDTRKRLNYTGVYALMRILHEVARRHGITDSYLNGLLLNQIDDFFEGTIREETLRRQHEEGLMLVGNEDGTTRYVFGRDAESEWNELTRPGYERRIMEVRGNVASRGIARGRARIMLEASSESASLMTEGDILITSMTRPEFLPLMKRASAIVTNEGGITSHAAIVSRELKKPCIIGTKNATDVFKDGDMIEVDANIGVVRRVESI